MAFPKQEYWNGLSFPSSGDLPDPGIEPESPALAGRFFTVEPPGKPFLVLLLVFPNMFTAKLLLKNRASSQFLFWSGWVKLGTSAFLTYWDSWFPHLLICLTHTHIHTRAHTHTHTHTHSKETTVHQMKLHTHTQQRDHCPPNEVPQECLSSLSALSCQ